MLIDRLVHNENNFTNNCIVREYTVNLEFVFGKVVRYF